MRMRLRGERNEDSGGLAERESGSALLVATLHCFIPFFADSLVAAGG